MLIIIVLAESVTKRLRENGFKCTVVEISVRDTKLCSFSRQRKLLTPTNITKEVAQAAFKLFKENYSFKNSVRSIGVRGADLVIDTMPVQTDLFMDNEKRLKLEKIDEALDQIRRRFGYKSIQRAIMYTDRNLSRINPCEDHTVHPHGYF